jgi:transcriptional regulator with XRE-family HTH domain
LSQARLATLSGVHRSFVSRLESGVRALDVTTTYILARALGVAPSRLIAELGRVVAMEKNGGKPRGR